MDVGDVAVLGIKVQVDGAEQAKATLVGLSAAGNQTADGFRTAFQQSAASAMDFARAGASAAQVAQLTGTSMATARDAVARFGGQIAETTGEIRGLAQAQQEMAIAGMKSAAAMDASTASFDLAGAGLGRLRMGFTTLVAEMSGVPPIMARIASTAAVIGAGMLPVLAALAALSAGLGVYRLMTEESRKAKEEQDKLTASLEQWYDAEKRGVAGERVAELEAERAKVAQLTSEYNNLKAAHDAAMQPGSDVTEGSLMFGVVSGGKADAIAAQIAKSQAAIKAAQDNITETQRKAAYDREGIYVSDLAHLVQYNVATAAERQKAVALLNDFQNQLTSAAKAASPELRNQLAEWVHTLQDALKPKVEKASLDRMQELQEIAESYAPKADAVTTALQKQGTVLAEAVKQANDMAVASANDARVAGLTGEAHALVAERIKAENEQRAANAKYAGDPQALAIVTAQIQASYDQATATIRSTEAAKDATDRQKELNQAGIDAAKIAKQNEDATTKQTAAFVKAAEEAKKYAQDMQDIWAKGIEKIVTNGTKSFHNFFDDVLRMFQSLMQRMQKEGKDSGLGYQLLGLGSSAITGGFAGYQIGQQTGNAATGALGGGAAGAIAGEQIAGGWGAVFGGFAGVIGGLLGAAKAHKDAAEAEKRAADAAYASLQKMNVQAGTGTTLDANVADAHSQAQQLFDAINAALPGLKNQIEREKELAQVRADEAAITAKLTAADLVAKQQFLDDTQARILAASGDVQGAAAIRQRLADEKAYNDAVQQFGAASAQVAAELAAETAEAAQRARDAAAANEKISSDLRVRQLYAQGLTAEGDALKRQQDERDEIDQDLKAGWTADQIAALKLTQQLEDEKKAHDDAAAAAERYTANVASLTAQFLALTGQGDASAMAGLIEQQRQATNSATASGATPVELAMLNVVQLFQRGQLEAQQEAKKQTDILNAQLKTAQDQLSTAKTQLQNDTQASDTLSKYRDSLSIGSLSALSPADQLSAARSQLQALYARAQGGDATAASGFTSAANTFLQQSQGYNASGPGYASDFQTVQKMASTLADQYANQKTLDQQQVDLLQKQVDQLTAAIAALQDANSIAQATQAKVVAELEAQRDATLAPNGALIDQFIALRDTLTGASRDIVSAERDVLVGDQNNLTKATADEIAAINAGASLQQIAQLEMVRQLELQKTATDDGFAKQIATLGAQLGFDSPVVQQLIAQQQKYDTGVEQQISAINGLGVSVVGALHAIQFPSTGGGSDTHTPSSGVGTGLPSGPSLPGGGVSVLPVIPGSGLIGTGLVHTFASGGDFGGGIALVGERGPELVNSGSARVLNASQTGDALARAAGASRDVITELRLLRGDIKALTKQGGSGTGAIVDRLEAVVQKLGSVEHESQLTRTSNLSRGARRAGGTS